MVDYILEGLLVKSPQGTKIKTVTEVPDIRVGTLYIKDYDENGEAYWLALRGFYDYSYIREKSYKEQPTRTETGDIIDIDNIPTFLTPRLTIKYKYMHIEEYRALRKVMDKRNEFTIMCYDPVSNSLVQNQMYEAPPPMPTSHIHRLQYMGVIDYTIEFIGTKSQIIEILGG